MKGDVSLRATWVVFAVVSLLGSACGGRTAPCACGQGDALCNPDDGGQRDGVVWPYDGGWPYDGPGFPGDGGWPWPYDGGWPFDASPGFDASHDAGVSHDGSTRDIPLWPYDGGWPYDGPGIPGDGGWPWPYDGGWPFDASPGFDGTLSDGPPPSDGPERDTPLWPYDGGWPYDGPGIPADGGWPWPYDGGWPFDASAGFDGASHSDGPLGDMPLGDMPLWPYDSGWPYDGPGIPADGGWPWPFDGGWPFDASASFDGSEDAGPDASLDASPDTTLDLVHDYSYEACAKAQAVALVDGQLLISGEIKPTDVDDDIRLPDTGCVGQTTKGAEDIYAVELQGNVSYRVVAEPDAGYNLAIYIASDCADMGGSCIAGVDVAFSRHAEELVFTTSAAGTYYIGVDSRYPPSSSYASGRYNLLIIEDNPPPNDTCAQATPLSLASGPVTIVDHTFTATATMDLVATGCTGTDTEGVDRFYSVDLEAGHYYQATLSVAAGFDAALYLFSDCDNPSGTCIGGAEAGAEGVAETVVVRPAQSATFYVAVDSPNDVSQNFPRGSYTLILREFTPYPNETCATATLLDISSGNVEVVGDTATAFDDVSLPAAGCTGTGTIGADYFYEVVLQAGQSYSIVLTPDASYNAALYLFSSCANPAGTCIAGSDNSQAGALEIVNFTPTVTQSYLIGIDSARAPGTPLAQGGFTLTIQ